MLFRKHVRLSLLTYLPTIYSQLLVIHGNITDEITEILGSQFLGQLKAFLYLCGCICDYMGIWVCTGTVHVPTTQGNRNKYKKLLLCNCYIGHG